MSGNFHVSGILETSSEVARFRRNTHYDLARRLLIWAQIVFLRVHGNNPGTNNPGTQYRFLYCLEIRPVSISALDDTEVRKLAGQYGDPGDLLREDWVPQIPGITSAGSYEDYARNPGKWIYAKVEN